MSDWNGGASHWQYSRWLKNIARNSRISEPTGAELAAHKVFLKYVWDPMTRTGTRPWLDTPFKERAVAAGAGMEYRCDIDMEPTYILVRLLEIVGRDFKKIPMSAGEKAQADVLIAATGNRRYGTGPLFGGVGGSLVTIP